jgi:hypothetical protein
VSQRSHIPTYDRLVGVECQGDGEVVLKFEETEEGLVSPITVIREVGITVAGFNPEEQKERREVVVRWLRRLLPPPPPDIQEGGEGVTPTLPPLPPGPVEGQSIPPILDREGHDIIPATLLQEELRILARLKEDPST